MPNNARLKEIEERNKRYKEICDPETNRDKSNKEIVQLSFELKQLNKQRDNDFEYLLAENKKQHEALDKAHVLLDKFELIHNDADELHRVLAENKRLREERDLFGTALATVLDKASNERSDDKMALSDIRDYVDSTFERHEALKQE